MAVFPESSKGFKKESSMVKGNLESGDVVINVNTMDGIWTGEIVYMKSATADGSVRTAPFAHIAIPKQIRRKRTKWALRFIKDIRERMKIEFVDPVDEDVRTMASYLFKTTDMNPIMAGLSARLIVGTVGVTLI